MKFKDVEPGTMIMWDESFFYVVVSSMRVVNINDEFNDYVVHYISSNGKVDFYRGNSNEEFLYWNEMVVNEQ